ncbi:ArsR/SmtB family transcription factor [Actinomadura rupiterrae]|uniref:ArsR/SmtB family transcription factor n=1 Tax=Actinomadura rupiterrae TaxID=559627 RepID=UPI0020A295EE|nr:ArsR family transcriptional regulator [Actinomadura rupiterrae]MCP2336806.1 DNA-binding transcriptional ArsR family regulator [Actinomadura rupiterrae]
MGLWLINVDTMATGRFVLSPLAETIGCLRDLELEKAVHPGRRAWMDAVLPGHRAHMSENPVAHAIFRSGLVPLKTKWNADFLTPPPSGEFEPSFEDELEDIRATPPARARADLEVSIGGPLPDILRRDDLPAIAADALTRLWHEAVEPYWPRRRRVLEADIIARTRQLSRDGWAGALEGLRPGTRWLGDGRFRINAFDYPPREISGGTLCLVPITASRGWVTWNDEPRHGIVYPCAGELADPEPIRTPQALARLLGEGRAAVLTLLDNPKSTTQLVALTGLPLGSVGRHLKILLEARLADRRRSGRSVLYYRTEAGNTLINAQRTP